MSQRRSALGRGLGALISNPPRGNPSTPDSTNTSRTSAEPQGEAAPSTGNPEASARLTHSGVNTDASAEASHSAPTSPLLVDVTLIDPNPDQPRREFDPTALQQLSESIEQHGVLQPVVVRRAGDRYELIMGERRFRASQLAGHQTIPVVVLDVDPVDRLELAIIENVQRQDLNPIELALAYRALSEVGHTQAEIGQKVSMDRSSVANHVRLLELSRPIQTDVENGRLSMGHAKALLQVNEEADREVLRAKILSESLSVRAAERAARQLNGGGARSGPPQTESAGQQKLDPDTRAYVERIERHLQTKVNIRPGAKGSGRLEINYFDLEDLERLGGMLLGESQ